MEKKLTGAQFMVAQLTQALGTIAQLLDENAALAKKIEELKGNERALPEGVTRLSMGDG